MRDGLGKRDALTARYPPPHSVDQEHGQDHQGHGTGRGFAAAAGADAGDGGAAVCRCHRTLVAELGAAAPTAGGALHPLLVQRDVHTVGVLLVTPDRGLAGALNTNIIRRGTEVIHEHERGEGGGVEVVTVGRKGQDFLARRGRKLMGTFTGIVASVKYDDVIPIARVITDSFINGSIDRAVLVYPRFISTLSQRPEVVQLLPIEPRQDDRARSAHSAGSTTSSSPTRRASSNSFCRATSRC